MIWLASNSPRRRKLLALGGWSFTVKPVDVDETPVQGEAPKAYVQRLAVEKARALEERLRQPQEAPQTSAPGKAGLSDPGEVGLVVAADTTLGKPADAVEAESMLRRLRGRAHWVYTGLAVLRLDDNLLLSDLCETRVVMRDYSEAEMHGYIASGDPLDKAGAYAIQHTGFHPVQRLEGCYANVTGLPLCALARLLARAGLPSPLETDLARACAGELDFECPFYPLKMS
jgi:septum formation protein